MLNFISRTYKSRPNDLLQFISMLELWRIPQFSAQHQEIVVATTIYTGVLETPRPMATLYIAEKQGHQPLCGTIELIDETGPNEQPSTIELRLEGLPFHNFNPNARWNSILKKRYDLQDCTALAREVREVIANHWASNWFTSVPFDQR